MKLSLVTPVYNGGRFIAKTLNSILQQESGIDLSYTIVDGGSTDDTLEIIESFSAQLIEKTNDQFNLISESDEGMYDALHKGLSTAKGEWTGYINSDDVLLDGCFAAIESIHRSRTEIAWFTGRPLTIDEHGTERYSNLPSFYANRLIREGFYGDELFFIQQESTFWKTELFEDFDWHFFSSSRYAGDYLLWKHLAQKTRLYQLPVSIGAARIHENRLSNNRQGYLSELREYSEFKSIPGYFLSKWNLATTFGLPDSLKKKWFKRIIDWPISR